MISENSERTRPGQFWRSKHFPQLSAGCPVLAVLFLVSIFVSGCVVHSHGHGRYKTPVKVHPHADVHVAPAPVTFVFTDHHRHTVHSYYRHHPRHPHGKRHKWKHKGRGHPGRGHGPPPWARKGGHMPPGIQMQRIPHDLAVQLPPAPYGTQYVYYDDHVLLVNLSTHVVLDAISITVGF